MSRRIIYFYWVVSLLVAAIKLSAFPSPETIVASDNSAAIPFGIATSASSLRTYANWAPAISSTGVKWVRGFDDFKNIEQKQGVWKWKNVDAELSIAARHKMEVSGLFFYGVDWIPTASGMPTSNLEAWSTYVSTVVKHVAGKVKYWEVWNEPPNYTNEVGTPSDYARIVNAAYTAAHAVDPGCQVALAAQSNNVNWLDQTIVAGAKDHFDYITVHPYEVLNTVANGGEAEFMSIVPTIRKMLAARDPAHANVPIWFTEIGEAIGQINGGTTVTEASQASDLVKAYSMGLAQGAARIHWFEAHDGDSGPMGLLAANGSPRPALIAMAQIIKYLGSQPVYLGWVLLNEKDYGFVFRGASNSVLVTWAHLSATDKVVFRKEVQVIDPLTGASITSNTVSLTNAPVLVVGIPTDLVIIAQSNKSKPFPWGGDHTRDSSISCFMREPNLESGLHQLYADTSSKVVMMYGGMVRDCSKVSSQTFTVDPNFLSYATVPIRITAVVRRNVANDSAGFNLKYESVSGWKTAGNWTKVPNNSQWSTVSWTINDAQFVGKWGYNFSLDSDSASRSRYYLQSVTVTKL